MKAPGDDYSIQLRLRERAVLLVGAGRTATRKLERLLRCGARVRVVAPRVSKEVHEAADAGRIRLDERAFVDSDLVGAFLVIAATDDRAANARIAEQARHAAALVLRVDAPEDSDFSLPALARAEHVEATVSTRGRAPAASRRLARELTAWLNAGPNRFVAEMARARQQCHDCEDRAERLRALSAGPLLDACRAEEDGKIRELLTAALESP